MVKVLPLEGPHKRHHDHGKDASVPDGKMLPKQHWEKHYSPYPEEKNSPASAFCPKRAKDRPCTHTKVNELDH
jgi:hypothetical protein